MNAIRIDPSDNVAVALHTLEPGETAATDATPVAERIPAKQKIALQQFAAGDAVRMYGVTVGTATQEIPRGGLLSTGNLVHASDDFTTEDRPGPGSWTAPDAAAWQGHQFQGFHRASGEVGTANYWLVIPMVFCENRNLEVMREAVHRALGYNRATPYEQLARQLVEARASGASVESWQNINLEASGSAPERIFPNVDGVKFLLHGLGCGGTGDDSRALCRLLAGYATHPNVAGVTVFSLGCQIAQVKVLEEEIALRDPDFSKPLHVFEQQKSKSEQDMIADAIRQMFSGLAEANELSRQPAPLSKLVFGMECGGSDGFSGISANPTIGHVSDLAVALGARTMLAEFPELCGVEQELIDRCAKRASAKKFAQLMRSYAARAEAVGSGLHFNPSPGNIRDGLITDAIKSAGAARKGGSSPVQDVLDYGEPCKTPGLNLLCTPGNDVESTTALAGSGANLMIFSTGLGTPTGNPICPTLKVATNSELATRMSDIIDFDCGPVIRGERTIDELGADLLNLAIQTASGEYMPKAVRLGQDDFLPWKRGVSL